MIREITCNKPCGEEMEDEYIGIGGVGILPPWEDDGKRKYVCPSCKTIAIE